MQSAARLRNCILLGYWGIDVETLVATAADDLPQTVNRLEGAVTSLQEAEAAEDTGSSV